MNDVWTYRTEDLETGKGTEENIPFLNVLVIQRGQWAGKIRVTFYN